MKKKYTHWTMDNKQNYRSFTSREEAENWGIPIYQEWADRYKESMFKVEKLKAFPLSGNPVELYCGYLYKWINLYLRYRADSEEAYQNHLRTAREFSGDDDSYTYRDLAHVLAFVVASAPEIPENIIVFRYVNEDFINILLDKNLADPSTPTLEKGFLSTSLIPDYDKDTPFSNDKEKHASFRKGPHLLKIYVEKGSSGIYVNTITRRHEVEMLLFPGGYLALIDDPYKDKYLNKIVYECRLMYFNV